MTHTPGPWRINPKAVIDCRYGRHSGGIMGANGEPVVVADPSEMEYKPALDLNSPDARLIAAAPELLEALEAAEEHLNFCGWGDKYERECARDEKLPEKIRAAIAKVRAS